MNETEDEGVREKCDASREQVVRRCGEIRFRSD